MIKISILIACMSLPIWGIAQDKSQDQQEIEGVVLGYIENFFLNDYAKMEVHLHERLSKRGVNQDGRLSEDYSKSDLQKLMSTKQAMPLRLQSNTIDSVFIDRQFASVVLSTGYPKLRWKEYIHLAKLEGKWIIMDVFWNFD